MQTTLEDGVSIDKSTISVLIVDDHCIVRDGLTAVLERCSRLRVVGEADNGAAAIAAAQRLEPDVILMDLMLPDIDGIEVTQRIRRVLPHTRVVILSASHSSEHIVRSLRSGALAYIFKKSASAEIVSAVLAVHTGKPYISETVLTALDGISMESAPVHPMERLSAREREVLRLTSTGASCRAIAEALCLSTKTVETYRSRIVRKLEMPDRFALLRFAIRHTLTDG